MAGWNLRSPPRQLVVTVGGGRACSCLQDGRVHFRTQVAAVRTPTACQLAAMMNVGPVAVNR